MQNQTAIGLTLSAILASSVSAPSDRLINVSVPNPESYSGLYVPDLNTPKIPQDSTGLAESLNQLISLLGASASDDLAPSLTTNAYTTAKTWLLAAHAILGERFLRPSLVSDGEGGVDIKWRHNGRLLMIGCTTSRDDFIYFRQNNDYDTLEPTIFKLRDRLTWLLSA
jgi:hypothetical protein